jgi:hypothetical protein
MQPITFICAVLILATPAVAETCRTDLRALPDLPPATVTADRLYFERGSCTDDDDAQRCRLGPYVVQGDRIFIAAEPAGRLICVGYLARGGAYSEGWVAMSGLRLGD